MIRKIQKPVNLFTLLLSTIGLILVSCNFWVLPEIHESPRSQINSALDKEDQLALWHLADSHETPEEVLHNIVQVMLQSNANIEERKC